MLLVIYSSQYNIDNLYFIENHKNVIDNDAQNPQFIRFIYSTNIFSLNSVSIHIPLRISFVEKYFSKYKCIFALSENTAVIQFIKTLETSILNHTYITNYHSSKTPLFKLSEQIQSGEIKLYNVEDKLNHIILKISGIWCTSDLYGLTYKYLSMSSTYSRDF